ncbi:MAG: glycosyltransferase family 4 protein [Cryomorphaceae bacterium]|nr:glycosyltransferase family 4 protein [Flavobacteriales bacterium]
MSTKPKVLVFSDWYLPGYKAGGPISSVANLVSNLGDEVDFRIVCSDRDYMDTAPYDLPLDQWQRRNLEEVIYLSPQNRELATIKAIIREVNPDVVYINGVFSKAFSIFPLRASKALGKKTVVAPRGMLAPGALGIKPAKKKIFLFIAKLFGAYNRIVFHATYKREQDHINRHFPNSRVEVIPNLPTSPDAGIRQNTKNKNEIELLCIARIAPEKNTLFALDLLHQISSDYTVWAKFVGPTYSEEYFESCRKLAAQMPDHVVVKFEGSVKPDHLKDYFLSSDLFFLPTLGENYGHAIIESLLHGLPVLISDQTPWLNLRRDELGADLPLGREEDFLGEIQRIAAMDAEAYRHAFGNVAANASKRIDLESTKSRYKKLFLWEE